MKLLGFTKWVTSDGQQSVLRGHLLSVVLMKANRCSKVVESAIFERILEKKEREAERTGREKLISHVEERMI